MKKEIKLDNTMIHSEGKMVSKQLVWQDPVLQLLNQSLVHADNGACTYYGVGASYGCDGGTTAGGICFSGLNVTQ